MASPAAHSALTVDCAATWKQTLAAIPQAVIVTDLAGRVTMWTGAAAEIYGWTAEETVGRGLADLLVPDLAQDEADAIMADLQAGGCWAGTFTACRKDGRAFPSHAMVSAVHDATGAIIGIIGISLDITDKLAAEFDLVEAEAKYRGIVETSLEGIWMLDAEDRTTFANARMAELLDCSPGQLATSSVFDFTHDRFKEGVQRLLDRLRRGEEARFETPIVRADGTELFVDLAASPLLDQEGRYLGALAMVSDVTARRSSVAALREEEERFRRVFDEGPLGGAIVGTDARIQRANSVLSRMLGYEGDELVGMTLADITHPDDIDASTEQLTRMCAGEIHDYQLEKRYLRKDGQVIVGRLTATLVRDETGDTLYAIGLVQDVTEAVEAARTIEVQQERLAMTLEAGGMAAWEIDLDTRQYTMADNLSTVVGPAAGESPDPSFEDFVACVHPDDRKRVFEGSLTTMDSDDTFAVEFRVDRDGEEAWVRSQGRLVRDDQGTPRSVRGTSVDVTDQRQAAEQRAEVAEVYRRTVEASSDGFVGADADGLITDWNPAAEAMFGWAASEVVGSSLVDRVFPVEDRGVYREQLRSLAAGTQPSLVLPGRMEMTALHCNGRRFPVEVSLVAVSVAGQTQVRGFVRDITERRAYERELRERALTDHLTGLPNRTLLADRLQSAISRIGRRARGAAVLFVDIDRFKAVNDSLGHRTGDILLVALAHRLRGAVRPDDTVARIGGDEFVVLCEDLAQPDEAIEVAKRIFRVLDEPFALGSRSHRVSLSIGIAHVDSPEVSADDLVRDADTAMHSAKAAGGARVEVFSAALRHLARSRLEVEDELRVAITEGQLTVFYQPVVTLDEQVVGLEALVRWEHPSRGIVPPGDFIPLAEETGLIVPLGEFVLDRACHQLAAWRRRPGWEHLTVAVNLSGRQLTETGLSGVVDRILRAHDLPPGALSLEITESMLMDDSSTATATLEALDSLGVCLAVDDFGTGYSSLLYLRRFPVRILKLDRFFVAGLGRNAADLAIIGSMIDLAHALGMTAIAEGVETRGQLEALRSLGCDRAQGYLWSRPVAADTMSDRLQPAPVTVSL